MIHYIINVQRIVCTIYYYEYYCSSRAGVNDRQRAMWQPAEGGGKKSTLESRVIVRVIFMASEEAIHATAGGR